MNANHLPAMVSLLTIVLMFWTSIRVGKARGTYGIKAPATTGNLDFERIFRVQMNTLIATLLATNWPKRRVVDLIVSYLSPGDVGQPPNLSHYKYTERDADCQDNRILQNIDILKILSSGKSASNSLL